MLSVQVIDDPAAAIVALEPVRARLLLWLRTPASAAMLAERVGSSRQKVGYHLTALAAHSLVQPAGSRQWGGITERLVVASAASYVVSPAALGGVAADPGQVRDRLSARYVIALAARVVREVGQLVYRAEATGKRVPTLTVDTEIRFASAATRGAFGAELSQAVFELIARYHDENAPPTRSYRLVLAVHPVPKESTP